MSDICLILLMLPLACCLTAARRNELEDLEQKPVRVQNKAAKVEVEEKTSPGTESIKDLKAQIQELATVMKSGSTSHRPNPPAVDRSPAKKFKRVNVKQNGAANVGKWMLERDWQDLKLMHQAPFILAKDLSSAINAKVGDMLKEFVIRV